ncbi:nucleotide exchange factor GrpE [Marinilactibacillus piezotolerans]|uniref:nucleotide exchange factor GrpE n=1 Tax=Marinilactibacillus piezotolerans TaxID=258723 RepID=UPI0009AFD1B7|nr:nucleotide exchange factor GrpE [Marinilactibacillus piezotolerans]
MTEKHEQPEELDKQQQSVDPIVEEAAAEAEVLETDPVSDELDSTKRELNEMEDRYLRLQAELANIQKRNQRDREQAARYRSQDLAKQLLPALDNMERALSIEVSDEAGKNLKKGVEMVIESLNQALKAEGVEVIEAAGKPFDPNFHEAYTQVPADNDQQSGTVAQVFEKGYKLHDRVLRAAKVAVYQ